MVLLSACNTLLPGNTPTPQQTQTVTTSPTATATTPPTFTPIPPLTVLLASEDSDPELVGTLQPMLADLSAHAGFRFQLRPDIKLEDFEDDNVQRVIVLPPASGLSELIAGSPDTHFVTIGIKDLEPSPNLSTIGAQAEQPEREAFIAGYISAVITPDWRVAVVTEADSDAGKAARLGFTNGVFFFCGLCRPVYPPFPPSGYPLFFELPKDAGSADIQAAATFLKSWNVETVYVFPHIASNDLLSTLSETGFNLISSGTPPTELENFWIASIGLDEPTHYVQNLWDKLTNNQKNTDIRLPIVIDNINADLFSPGRQLLVEKMMKDLEAGFIDVGVNTQPD